MIDEDIAYIRITKVDFCQDLAGSFIPENEPTAYEAVKGLLSLALAEAGGDECVRLSTYNYKDDLAVKSAGGRLRTCFKYDVVDTDSNKRATIKFYDKMLDLIGREGCLPVGSRLSTVLGSTNNLSSMREVYYKAQSRGITRVEVSVHLNNCEDPIK